nr:MAPEG family protein [uncultured Rhodopila sp.]
MTYPLVTSGYAALLALIFLALSAWVVAGRFGFKVNHGDGGDVRLNRRIRAHANFAEYVPFILFLVALLEARATSRFTVHALLLPLLIARVAHPFGMLAPENAFRQFAFRGASVVVTLTVLAAAAVLLLLDLA